MSEKCACRIEVNGLVDLDSEKKIKMCPTHAAAFQMLAALKRLVEAEYAGLLSNKHRIWEEARAAIFEAERKTP